MESLGLPYSYYAASSQTLPVTLSGLLRNMNMEFTAGQRVEIINGEHKGKLGSVSNMAAYYEVMERMPEDLRKYYKRLADNEISVTLDGVPVEGYRGTKGTQRVIFDKSDVSLIDL